MRHILAVARLEWRAWRSLPIVALALGLLPLLAWFVVRERLTFELVYAGMARTGFTLCAVTTGALALTRDLREGRAAFLHARPLSSASLWLGRLVASFSATALALALYLLPGWHVHAAPLPVDFWSERLPLFSPGDAPQAVWLAGLGQWAALALAGGGWRRAVDAVTGLAFYVLASWHGELLVEDAALGSPAAMAVTHTLLAAPLLIAGLVQARRAPDDVERAYAVFSNANLAAMASSVALVWLCR